MSAHEKTEDIEQSVLSANEFNSESDEREREAVPNQKQQDPIDFLIVTRIPQKTYKFQWIIRQFSVLSKNKALYSTCINALPTSCYLKLVKYEHGFGLFHEYQREVQQKTTNKAGFSFGSCHSFGVEVINREPEEASNASDFTLNLEYQVSATDSKGKELMKWSICFSGDSESTSGKIGEYMNNSLEYFPDDSLTLNCNLKIISIPTTEEILIASKPSLECNSWNNLSKDYKTLHQTSLDTDITLVVGANKICAHKLILTARSTVFKKIFHHDMAEAEKNSVVIADVDFSTLQRLVEFLYTGVILDGKNKDMDLQELYDLYYAADKYEIMDLREMTGNTLMGRIQVDNASEILVWADHHDDKDLKSRIMNFIRINFEVVSNTDAWESCTLHHPELAVEAVNFCFKKLNIGENKI